MPELTDREREGRRMLTRHHYGDGRWGTGAGQHTFGGWTLVKHRPHLIGWAKATGRNSRLIHAVRYHLVAQHRDGTVMYLTVWKCGGMSHSPIEAYDSKPEAGACRRCEFQLTWEAAA